ncbi:MAG: hypothetical protein O2983_10510 [Planctomycetota bacterium]|nr:hypothetical protein [Planctomycetota bacterium]MDA0920079.1 hypothetical protein [Planctomycetota bacterium]MDA1160031.1 hypothetical protein [Planctomycetota bacterium]
MASDQELRTLINTVVTDQRAARRIMAGMTMAILELASKQNLDISDDQAKDVARSLLVSRLADIAWPDATSTSFEIPVQRGE